MLIPTQAHIRNLDAARLAADVCGVPTLLVARTDAESAKLITSDVDERDHEFLTGERTAEGFSGSRTAPASGTASSAASPSRPMPILLWWETSHPNLEEARIFAEAVQREYPGKAMAYNCSPSFNWEAKLDRDTIARFQRELGAMGYKFQFVTLAGFHSLNHGMFELASGYRDRGMAAYSELQRAEFAAEAQGYTATRHQREVGTGYFDLVAWPSPPARRRPSLSRNPPRRRSSPTRLQLEEMENRYGYALLGRRGRISRSGLPVAGPRHRKDGRPVRGRAQGAQRMDAPHLWPGTSPATTRYSIAAEALQ